jgi:hypothetical protein
VTAACPLLSAGELKTLLGSGTSRTKWTAKEEEPEVHEETIAYNCDYGSNGKYPFVLGVQMGKLDTPSEAIEAVATASKVRTHRVAGVGAAGVFYNAKSGVSLLAAAKRSHGETRMTIFVAPTVVPEQKFIEVTKVVMARI